MGMYTGIRFKGYVKEEYREAMRDIAMEGNWDESNIPEFKKFGDVSRSSFIPCGSLAYMPDEWEEAPSNEYVYGKATEGFECTYNEETGYWAFQCSLKNYDDTIEEFFNLIPLFIEKIDHLEYFYNEWDYSKQYGLVFGNIRLLSHQFVKYGY